MDLNYKILEETKNKRGEIQTRVTRLTNGKDEKEGLSFEDINIIYKLLLKKYKPQDIVMIGKHMNNGFDTIIDGKRKTHSTLKSSKYNGEDLKHMDDEYFDSAPKKGVMSHKDRLRANYYSIDIIINR